MYERYWLVWFWKNGFKALMLVHGTERELWKYLNSEIGGGDETHTGNYSYRGASLQEVAMAEKMGLSAYLAPKIK
jgi:hypothetical protein